MGLSMQSIAEQNGWIRENRIEDSEDKKSLLENLKQFELPTINEPCIITEDLLNNWNSHSPKECWEYTREILRKKSNKLNTQLIKTYENHDSHENSQKIEIEK